MLNLEQYQGTILEIANKVDQLITDTAVKKCFADHIDRFCKMIEDYEQALQPYKEKLKTSDNASAVLKELGSTQPAKLVNPLCWLSVSGGYAYGYEFCWLFGVFGDANKLQLDPIRDNTRKLQRDPTEDEKLMCEYVLLAIIHDWELKEPTDRRFFSNKYNSKEFAFIGMVPDGEGIRFTESEKVKLTDICRWVWQYFLNPVLGKPDLIETRPTASEALHRLNRALEHVHADLASTKLNKSQPAKGAKYWFKSVCKVIVGLGILLGILWTAIQIYESATFRHFVVSRHKSQSVSDPNAQTEFNDIKMPSKTNHDTSNSLPDLNLSPPGSPNQ